MRADPHQDATMTASAAGSGAAAAFHAIHAAPMQGMGYVPPLGGTGVLDDYAHVVRLYPHDVLDPDPFLQKGPVPAWKQRIPHHAHSSRVECAPDAKTRAKLRAKRKR